MGSYYHVIIPGNPAVPACCARLRTKKERRCVTPNVFVSQSKSRRCEKCDKLMKTYAENRLIEIYWELKTLPKLVEKDEQTARERQETLDEATAEAVQYMQIIAHAYEDYLISSR